jgi:hypothetical protein
MRDTLMCPAALATAGREKRTAVLSIRGSRMHQHCCSLVIHQHCLCCIVEVPVLTCALPWHLPPLQCFAKDYEKAVMTYATGLEHNPDNEELKNGQAQCFMALQQVGRGAAPAQGRGLWCASLGFRVRVHRLWGLEHRLLISSSVVADATQQRGIGIVRCASRA